MTRPTDPGAPVPAFNRAVVGIGGLIVAGMGAKVAFGGRIGDRHGWSMDAPVSAAIAGGLFAVAGLVLLLVALFWRRGGRTPAVGGEPPQEVERDSATGPPEGSDEPDA